MFSTFNHLSQNDCWKEGCSEQQNKNCPRIADFPIHLPKIFRPLTAIVLVTASRKAAAFVLSHVAQEKGVPGARSALRVDQVASFPNSVTCAFIKRTVLELSFLLFQCLFVFPAADSV